MNDPDEDAFSWAGDDRLQAPRERSARPAPGAAPGATGAVGLVVLGVLGGVAVLETVFWIRSAFQPAIAATLGAPGGPAQTAAFAINVFGRVLGAVAPVVWFAVVASRVRDASRRLAWLALGAVLLVPWPAVLGLL